MLLLSESALSIAPPFSARLMPLHRFRQQHHEGGAHQRAHDRAGAADDDHGEEQDRTLDAEAFLRNHELIMRVERARDAGEEGGEAKRQRAVFGEVDAHDLGGEIVVANCDQCAAVAGAHQIGDKDVARDHIGQHDVEILPVATQRVAEDRERVGARRHRAAGEPLRAGEEVEQDVLRGERRDHEVEPLQSCRRDAEDEADQRGDDAGERDREEHRDRRVVGDVGRGEGAEQEEGGVPDRDLAGEADQDVQPKRRDREDADLDQDAEPVAAKDLRHEAKQKHADDREVAAGRGREDRGVRRVRWCGNRQQG